MRDEADYATMKWRHCLRWSRRTRLQQPAAASDDALELSLEEELNAMLDSAHAEPAVQTPVVALAPEPAPRQAAVAAETRWSTLEADKEHEPTPAVAPVSPSRRPFIDPTIVGRLASFKAAPAATPAPKIEPAPRPEEDLDALLDAMERGPSGRSRAERRRRIAATPPPGKPSAAGPPTPMRPRRPPRTMTATRKRPGLTMTRRRTSKQSTFRRWRLPSPTISTFPSLPMSRTSRRRRPMDDLDADYARAFAEPAMPEEPASPVQQSIAKHCGRY